MARRDRRNSGELKQVHDGMTHLILCEGLDEWRFLVTYLNSPVFADYPAISRCIQVENFGGNEDLNTQLQLWPKVPGFENLNSLIVIRDAETNAKSAMQSIVHAFQTAELPAPVSPALMTKGNPLITGFLLFPACDTRLEEGTLEDLCLSILNETDREIMQEIDSFLNHLKEKELRTFPHEFKSKLHTYFSITDKYVSLKIGEAAAAGAFDWTSPKLDPLRDFLIQMVSS